MQTRREALGTIFGTILGASMGGVLSHANELGKDDANTQMADGSLTPEELDRQARIAREGFDINAKKKDSPIFRDAVIGGTLAFLATKAGIIVSDN